ncbi:MAG: hypothetical protein Kow0022_02660 [Phycisphaerales bacterium]
MTGKNAADMGQLARAAGIAWDMASNLAAGLLFGAALDWVGAKLFGWTTFPILMLVFGGLGLAHGMLHFFRDALRLNRELSRDWKKEHDAEGESD